MKKNFLIIIVLLLNGCVTIKDVGNLSVTLKGKSKIIDISENSSFYFSNASLIRSKVMKRDSKDYITDGNDIVIVVKFDFNTSILHSTDSWQYYTTFMEINNFSDNQYNIEVDTSNSLIYTKYQAFIVKKYFYNPSGSISIIKKGNDSLLVNLHLKYTDELELQGEFITLRDKQKAKFF